MISLVSDFQPAAIESNRELPFLNEPLMRIQGILEAKRQAQLVKDGPN